MSDAAAIEGPMLSGQQAEAIRNVVVDRVHTVVTACPGAGKSTVFREALRTIAITDPFASVAIISYNRALKEETEGKVKRMEFPETFQVDAFTSHGLLGRMFGSMVPDDLTAYQLLRSEASTSTAPADYSYVFVDEAQDMSILTARIINHLIGKLPVPPVMFVVGDLRQQLYGHLNMDLTGSTALRTPAEVFGVPGEWRHVNFNRSFRLSPNSADWLSTAFRLTGPDRIIGANLRSPNTEVSYSQAYEREIKDVTVDAVLMLLRNYPPGKIIIKSDTVDYSGVLRSLVNTLSNSGIPVYVSDHRRGTSTGKEAVGKILITTSFQAKGLEREASVVLLKQSFGREPGEFDPAWFVAMSRHTDMMVVIDNRNNPHFQIHGGGQVKIPRLQRPVRVGRICRAPRTISEGKLARFTRISLVLNLVERMIPKIKVTPIVMETNDDDDTPDTLDMPSNANIQENVGRYYRDAVQLLSEIKLFPGAPILVRKIEKSESHAKKEKKIQRFFPAWDSILMRACMTDGMISGADAMLVSAGADCFESGYHHLIPQLARASGRGGSWVTQEMERFVEASAERVVAGLFALDDPLERVRSQTRLGPGMYQSSTLESNATLCTPDAVIEIELASRNDDAIKFQQKDIDLLVRMYVTRRNKAHIILCATNEMVTLELDDKTIEGYVHSIFESKYLPR